MIKYNQKIRWKLILAVWSQTYDSEILAGFNLAVWYISSYFYTHRRTFGGRLVDPPNRQIFRLYGMVANHVHSLACSKLLGGAN